MASYPCRICGEFIVVKPRNNYPGKAYTCNSCRINPPVGLKCKGVTSLKKPCSIISLPNEDFCAYHKKD
jgi:hypothetical protein